MVIVLTILRVVYEHAEPVFNSANKIFQLLEPALESAHIAVGYSLLFM